MHSALYRGRLRHRRFAPRSHEFSYPLHMLYIDLAELDWLFERRWFWSIRRAALGWFKRSDYLGDTSVPLDRAIRDRVEAETGSRPCGPIRMLTHLRLYGFNFNPVTFYYCFDQSGAQVDTIVAEITNTPWKERHAYILTRRMNVASGRALRFVFKKDFHVSPFFSMDYDYDWRFSEPGERLSVHMENFKSGDKAFDATLGLERSELTGAALCKVLLQFPCMPARVVIGIYWQAFKLWLKGIPVHTNPSTLRPEKQPPSRAAT